MLAYTAFNRMPLGSDQHIERLRLVEFSGDSGFQLTDEESFHLLDCAECQELFIVLVLWFKQRSQDNGSPLRYAS